MMKARPGLAVEEQFLQFPPEQTVVLEQLEEMGGCHVGFCLEVESMAREVCRKMGSNGWQITLPTGFCRFQAF